MDNVTPVAAFRPNYKQSCEVCGNTPCVNGIDAQGRVVYRGELCGVCTWGEAAMADPDNWNGQEDL